MTATRRQLLAGVATFLFAAPAFADMLLNGAGGKAPAGAGNFIDDNGITSWIDNNGVTSWTDDLGH